MVIQVPEEVFGIKKWEAKVVRNYNVASFIKEFVVEIPEAMDYKAGGYIQIEIPQCEVHALQDHDFTCGQHVLFLRGARRDREKGRSGSVACALGASAAPHRQDGRRGWHTHFRRSR